MDDDKKLTLSIRRATVADIGALAGLLAYIDALHQPHDQRQIRQGSPQRADQEQLTKGIIDPATVVLVGESGGNVVGYARMEIRNTKGNRLFNPTRPGVVHEVGVAEGHGRNGIGTALMDALRAAARSAGVERIQLEHYAGNAAAGRLYARLGYSAMRVVCVKDL